MVTATQNVKQEGKKNQELFLSAFCPIINPVFELIVKAYLAMDLFPLRQNNNTGILEFFWGPWGLCSELFI